MKTIGLLRHAKSAPAQPWQKDFDRPLTDRGHSEAKFMGREIGRRGMAFHLVLASPARRVLETLQAVEQGYGTELQTRFEPQIFDASAAALLTLIQGLEASLGSVLLVGHNPALQQMAMMLMSEPDPLRAQLEQAFPTAALVLLHCKSEQWHELRPKTARSVAFLQPRMMMREDSKKS